MGAKAKTIILASGSEEGFQWQLQLKVYEGTKNFAGSFILHNEEAKRKEQIRVKDRRFFTLRLSGEMYRKYEIDHDWDNGGRVTLKTPKEHRNDNNGKTNQTNWVEEEDWLEEQ